MTMIQVLGLLNPASAPRPPRKTESDGGGQVNYHSSYNMCQVYTVYCKVLYRNIHSVLILLMLIMFNLLPSFSGERCSDLRSSLHCGTSALHHGL